MRDGVLMIPSDPSTPPPKNVPRPGGKAKLSARNNRDLDPHWHHDVGVSFVLAETDSARADLVRETDLDLACDAGNLQHVEQVTGIEADRELGAAVVDLDLFRRLADVRIRSLHFEDSGLKLPAPATRPPDRDDRHTTQRAEESGGAE